METLLLLAKCGCCDGRAQYLDECIVKQEHGRSAIPHPCPTIIEHVTEITNVADLWVPDAEFPEQVTKQFSSIRNVGSLPNDQ